MLPQVHPSPLAKAIRLIDADPARAWRIDELAAACSITRRALEKQFRRFVRRTPVQYLRDVRLGQARRLLLASPVQASPTELAERCGFNHPGRFAIWYRERYGESPSATLRRSHAGSPGLSPPLARLVSSVERPSLTLLPFELVGHETSGCAGIGEEIARALLRLRWITVSTSARNARYRLSGKVRGDGSGRLRVTVILTDGRTGQMLWADHWDGRREEALEFEGRVAGRVAGAIEPALRRVEIDRASRQDPDQLSAWELSMRALPGVLSYKPAAAARALELLDRAMELAPQDPLPVSLTAWCRGIRGCLHFAERPDKEKAAAHDLAARAVALNRGDVLTETALATGYTLSHDLAAAAMHADRALALDGGSAWAWMRRGWIDNFRGSATEAIERLMIARALAQGDPVVNASASFGIASSLFQVGRYGEAARWMKRGIAERPDAVGMSPFFLASVHALQNQKDDARQTLDRWVPVQPTMTISRIKSGWPFSDTFLERVAEGLEYSGMRDPMS
jgi:AraC-like DNA-binding protein/tetratricopeptide (TPR) repeat protein